MPDHFGNMTESEQALSDAIADGLLNLCLRCGDVISAGLELCAVCFEWVWT